MFQKSKYDVMESENSKNTMSLFLVVGKIYKDLKSYEEGKMDKNYFNAGFVDAIRKCLPNVKAIAHIGYENSIDLEKVNADKLYKYMQESGLSREEFTKNYVHIINTYVKVILAFAIIDKECLNVYRIVTPEVLLGLIKGEFKKVKDVIDELDVNVSSDSKILMDKLVKDDFDIKQLTKEEKILLDKEHALYMKKDILPKVTKKTEILEVVKHAKSIGKKKSVLEI